MPEPACTRRIERLLFEVAEKCDHVALDVAAKALRTGFVLNGEPKERHCTNHLANFTFEGLLGHAHATRRVVALAPAWKIRPPRAMIAVPTISLKIDPR